MSGWLVVWLVLTLLSIVALAAVLVGLVRSALVLGRSVSRFGEELGPLTSEIGDQGRRAAERGSSLQRPEPPARH